MYIFQKIRKSAAEAQKLGKIDLKNQKEAQEWYRNEALSIGRVDRNKIMNTAEPFKLFPEISGAAVGKLYMFVYDAKHKATLPFYDKFPLVFPLQFDKGGFLGINLHYLPPVARAGLMDALYTEANNENYNKSMKLIIDYGKLKQNPIKFSGYQECVKRYLFDHVKSPFHYVNPKDWDKALMLPMQKWAVNPDKRYAKAPPY